MSTQPHHIGINVADLDRSMAFYEHLGFREVSRGSAEGGATIVFMECGGLQVELFAYPEPLPTPARPHAHAPGFRHFALITVDIDAEVARLQGAGIVPEDAEVRDLQNGIRLLYFPDPDGVELEIVQLPVDFA